MRDGKLNICYNALDRHLDKKGSQVINYKTEFAITSTYYSEKNKKVNRNISYISMT